MAKATPLLDVHRELGAEFTTFAGWRLPLAYGSVVEEHMAVRTSAGVFDVSHMGRLLLSGRAHELLTKLLPRALDEADVGSMQGPTVLMREDASVLDDVMPYNLGGGEWLLVVNAAARSSDLEWIESWASLLNVNVTVRDLTEETCMIALQGPKSVEVLSKLGAPRELLELERMRFLVNVRVGGAEVWVASRSGWTGEDGFEFILDCDSAAKLFRAMVDAGARPCGLAARDSLRVEEGYPLRGREFGPDSPHADATPVELRYWAAIEPRSSGCIGCASLESRLASGARKVLLALKCARGARAIPRSGDPILVGGRRVGVVTSGAYSPVLGRPVALAYVEPRHSLPGLRVSVARGRREVEAKLVVPPLRVRGR